jgi:hypothetical protein
MTTRDGRWFVLRTFIRQLFPFSFLGFGCGGTDRGNLQQETHGTKLGSCLRIGQLLKHDQSTRLEQRTLSWISPDNLTALYKLSMVSKFTPDIVSPDDDDDLE